MGSTVDTAARERVKFRPDDACLLTVMDGHYMVKVLEVTDVHVRVSFPGMDYPVEGMPVELEFHDDRGFFCYQTEVIQGPRRAGDGVLLRCPTECARNEHREFCRVPTDLAAQVRDQIHLRKYTAPLWNLSCGGALINTDAAFDLGTTVELTMSLPSEPELTLLGHVMHVSRLGQERPGPTWVYGIRFLALDSDQQKALTSYIWRRLKEIYALP